MRILVTGAAGFIGAHVTRALLASGHEVAAMVRPKNPVWRLRDVLGQLYVITGSLGDADLLRSALDQFKLDACIHLAWYAEPGKYLHSPENLRSLTESLGLLQEAIRAGCGQIVMAGTCAEYDTDAGYLHEDGKTHPATLYAAAKLSCCLLGHQIASQSGIDFAWGRVFYPYGPQEDERRVIPALIHALGAGQYFPATAGEQVRDYLHVEDVASAFCHLAEKRAAGIFNISSGTPVTMRHVLETAATLTGRAELVKFGAVPYRDWEPRFICGNNERLKALGWKPRYSLLEGLQQTLNWWASQAG